jgi:hypothetical protein
MIEANYLNMRAGGARGLDQLPHRLWRAAGRRRKTVDHVQYVHERPWRKKIAYSDAESSA